MSLLITDRSASPVADDFWVSSGHHLVDRSEGKGLVVSDSFLKAYLARPELLPPAEACPVERALHARLIATPRAAVPADELALVADADARENLALYLSFRDRLIAHPTLEAAYLSLLQRPMTDLPPLFLQQLTHVIARNVFDDEADGRVLRAAECFFRPQRVTFHEGAVLLADEDAIAGHEQDREHSPLLGMLGGPAVSELEILTDDNAAGYRARSDAHDLVFDLSGGGKGRAALASAMSQWIAHLTGLAIAFSPVDRLAEQRVGWFLALDADGTAIGNKVWQGRTLPESEQRRILALFSFSLPIHPRLRTDKHGAKGFAILGSSPDRLVRIKPQNLIAGLPLAEDAS